MSKKRNITEELKYLARGEMIAIIVIIVSYFVFKYTIEMDSVEGFALYPVSLYPLVLLTLILIQGSLYWENCLKRTQKKKVLSRQQIGAIYHKLRFLNWCLILCYIPLFILCFPKAEGLTVIGGLILYLGALIEQINYFHIRLSYYGGLIGLKVIEPFIGLLTGKGKKSQIARDIALYRRER